MTESKKEILVGGMHSRINQIDFTLRMIGDCNDPAKRSKMDKYDSSTCQHGGYSQFSGEEISVVPAFRKKLDDLSNKITEIFSH